MNTYEVNFDGIVGLTHHYAGLSHGNIASHKNALRISNPRAAALQGLQKMKTLAELGLKQAVLPPHERPHIQTLIKSGFSGNNDQAILDKAWKTAPEMTAKCYSASAMWVANAATVSPFADTSDGRTHFTPANLSSMFHRSIEPGVTSRILQAIFSDPNRFSHHAPLATEQHLTDEGAANHTRFCASYDKPGVELFVYGAEALNPQSKRPKNYPARQTLEASQAIAQSHLLKDSQVVFAQQHPDAIDAGVFHNDVIAVGNRNVLFFHEKAFLNKQSVLGELRQKLLKTTLHAIEVPEKAVPLVDAVNTYLFNTQLVSTDLNNDAMSIIAPTECEENPKVKHYLDTLISQNSLFKTVHYFNLRESMQNGGGPACLRLRVVMSDKDISSIKSRVFLDNDLYIDLQNWINKHYRDQLSSDDLRDPAILEECYSALDELTRLLKLGSIYDFQRP